jgi:hypothetical protein
MHIDNDCVDVLLSTSKDCAIYMLDVRYHLLRYTAASGHRWLSPTLRSQAVVYLRHDPCNSQGASHNTAIGCNTQLRHICNNSAA